MVKALAYVATVKAPINYHEVMVTHGRRMATEFIRRVQVMYLAKLQARSRVVI